MILIATEYRSMTRRAFSLAEVLVALVIAASILATALGIYSRYEHSADVIARKLDSSQLPLEIMQRIAEDLDKAVSRGSGTKVTVENKLEQGFPTARLTIRRTIQNKRNQEQTFEEITWQTSLDADANSLALYRSHSGMAMEDKLLDEKRAGWEENYPFVPICNGITFFKIQIPMGENFQDKWTSASLPPGITVTLSFARPFRTVRGTLDVLDTEKIIRTIAIDRTRKIKFKLAPTEDK